MSECERDGRASGDERGQIMECGNKEIVRAHFHRFGAADI